MNYLLFAQSFLCGPLSPCWKLAVVGRNHPGTGRPEPDGQGHIRGPGNGERRIVNVTPRSSVGTLNGLSQPTYSGSSPPPFNANAVDWGAVHTLASCRGEMDRVKFLFKTLGAILLFIALLFSGLILAALFRNGLIFK
jgi:hypothetical protein